MTERNKCHELGCPAACCKNIVGHMAVSPEFFIKAFPHAKLLGSEEELARKVKDQELGVYYFVKSGWTYFSVSGSCPNLDKELNCEIHDSRFYPRACSNMTLESRGCLEAQIINKIDPIFKSC